MNTLVNIEIARTFYSDIFIYLWGIEFYIPPDMLKELLKNAGLLVILAGVIVLGISVFTKVQTNANLSLSLGLVVGGLIAHIVISKVVE